MKNKHLTDKTLQAFLLKEIQDESIAAHLNVCSNCRKRLEEYQYVADGLQKIKTDTFSFDVTSLAMSTIMLYENRKRKKQALIFWGLLFFLTSSISLLAIPCFPYILALFNSKSPLTTSMILGTGLVVLLFLLADMTQQYKTKEQKLFKNNLQPTL